MNEIRDKNGVSREEQEELVDNHDNTAEDPNGKQCSNCNDVPQNIIYLGCNHVICLICVANIGIENSDDGDVNFSEFNCQICGEPTEFSEEIQQNLYEIVNENESENEIEKEEESVDEESEEQESESQFESPMSLYCDLHEDEQYTMYNVKLQKLYCNQCLLNAKIEQNDISFVKPLKKCFPEIFQDFQILLNKADVCKNLLENKFKNYDILKENSKNQGRLVLKNFEIAADNLIEMIQCQKKKMMKMLEEKLDTYLSDLEEKEINYQNRIDYFGSISSELAELQEESENPHEEMLEFYFNNKERITKAIQEQDEDKSESQEKDMFKEFEKNIHKHYDDVMEKNYKQIISNTTQMLSSIQKKSIEKPIEKPKVSVKINPSLTMQNDINSKLNVSLNSSRYFRKSMKMDENRVKPDYSKFLKKIRQQSIAGNERSMSHDLNSSRNYKRYRDSKKDVEMALKNNSILIKQTMEERDYNIQKKLEMDKKLNIFNFKSKKSVFSKQSITTTNFRKKGGSLHNRLDSLQAQIRMRALKPKISNGVKTCFNFY